jgi:PAS domain S-box-containing protein
MLLTRQLLRTKTAIPEPAARTFASTGGGGGGSFWSWLFSKKDHPSFVPNTGDPHISFSAMDTNNDGVVSREEFINGVIKYRLPMTPAETSALFDTLDSNKDGVLSPSEFSHHAWNQYVSKNLPLYSFETGFVGYTDEFTPDHLGEEWQKACERVFSEQSSPMVITEAQAPYQIVHVNGAWTNVCGFSAPDSYGKSLGVLKGPETDRETLRTMMNGVRQGKGSDAQVTYYSKTGELLNTHLTVEPIHCNSGRVTHFLATLRVLESA